jgi:signal transduction histidine kinase
MTTKAHDELQPPTATATATTPKPRAAAKPSLKTAAAPDVPSPAEEIEALRAQVVALQRVSSLGVLAGGVIHELNNALTPILSYAKLGLRNPDPEYRRRALEKILDAAQRASTITGGVLGLARPRADRREPTDLVRLAEEVLMLVHKDLSRNRVKLDFQAEGRPHARTNPAQIQQVLMNLVINARQAMPTGGTVHVRVAADSTGRLAELVVADTGVGIPPADLRRIFEPFFTTKTGPDALGLGGTGLGLSVCRDIVESHHGRLRAESRVGQGTTFTLRLPSCPAPTPASQGAA